MDWKIIHLAAQLAAIAYVSDAKAAADQFHALGYAALSVYANGDHQAYMLLNPDSSGLTLAISGTRADQGKIGDVLDDAKIVPRDLGDGAKVMDGTYAGLPEVYAWAKQCADRAALLSGNAPRWTVVGHSLGGERALLAGLFLDAGAIDVIFAFEAPKCGNTELWGKLAVTMTKAVCTINGFDLWAGWPWISDWTHPPIAHIHLLEQGFEMVGPGSWPAALDPADHSMGMVSDRLAKLAGATPA